MKQFDITQVKAGDKVVTRDGCYALIIYTNANGKYPVIGVINGDVMHFTAQGRSHNEELDSDYDLFIPSVKKQGWINIYKESGGSYESGCVYDTKEIAQNNVRAYPKPTDTVMIEWEE
jgi:hypothetical protein